MTDTRLQTNGFPAFVEPVTYSLAAVSTDEESTPTRYRWNVCVYQPGNTATAFELVGLTGGEAHKDIQGRFPGARYAPQAPTHLRRKYRGKYPRNIRSIGIVGALALVDCNDGDRYSIPVSGNRPMPAIGDHVAAFERTDTHGATYSPDNAADGSNLEPEALASICARYDAARVDIAADVKAGIAATWAALLPSAPATVEPEAAPIRMTQSRTADGASVLSESYRRDNVEYHAGKAAREAGQSLADCPYMAGGVRAGRWTLGWHEGVSPAPEAAALFVITCRTIDGREWLSRGGWTGERGEAVIMSEADALTIAAKEKDGEEARPDRNPDNGRYNIKASPYAGPALYTLAEYEEAEAFNAMMMEMYGDQL